MRRLILDGPTNAFHRGASLQMPGSSVFVVAIRELLAPTIDARMTVGHGAVITYRLSWRPRWPLRRLKSIARQWLKNASVKVNLWPFHLAKA